MQALEPDPAEFCGREGGQGNGIDTESILPTRHEENRGLPFCHGESAKSSSNGSRIPQDSLQRDGGRRETRLFI